MSESKDQRRRFTDWQARQKLVACGGKCERCGNQLPDRFHMHHVRRHADGGPTLLINAQALCPECHKEAHSEDA